MKKLIAITLVALSLVLVNCKDKTKDPDPTTTKTLNKSLMIDKYWTSTNPPAGHYFRKDGKYCLPDGITEDGTWEWLNNSDSLLIDKPSTTGKTVWYAEYCTETELKMRISGDKFGIVFTKQ